MAEETQENTLRFESLLKAGLGLGIELDKLYSMRVKYLRLKIAWHDEQYQKVANLVRMQTAMLINPHIKEPITDVAKFWPMYWDTDHNLTPSLSPQEQEETEQQQKRLVNFLNKK